jgi:hypothetical protein
MVEIGKTQIKGRTEIQVLIIRTHYSEKAACVTAAEECGRHGDINRITKRLKERPIAWRTGQCIDVS